MKNTKRSVSKHYKAKQRVKYRLFAMAGVMGTISAYCLFIFLSLPPLQLPPKLTPIPEPLVISEPVIPYHKCRYKYGTRNYSRFCV